MRVAIIGAGPSGLAAAYELVRRGVEVDVYERTPDVGGLARTLTLWGEPVELGPHFIVRHVLDEDEKALFAFFADAKAYRRSSRILLGGAFYDYPPRPLDILRKWGLWLSLRAAVSLVAGRVNARGQDQSHAEGFVRSALGDVLYRRFFKGYTEKLWGRPCRDIDAAYARALIGFEGLTFKKLAAKLVTKPPVSHEQCIHPSAGLGVVWQRLREAIEAMGGRFFMAASVQSLSLVDQRVNGLTADGQTRQYDHVLSCVPDGALWRLLPSGASGLGERLAGLPSRKLALFYARLRSADVMADNTVYIYTPDIRAVRATNFNRFLGKEGEGTVLLEYWLDPVETMSRDAQEVARVACQDLRALGVDESSLIDWHVEHVSGAYQVPNAGLRQAKAELKRHIDTYQGLTRLGRSSQDLFNYGVIQAMRDGLAAAKSVLASKPL